MLDEANPGQSRANRRDIREQTPANVTGTLICRRLSAQDESRQRVPERVHGWRSAPPWAQRNRCAESADTAGAVTLFTALVAWMKKPGDISVPGLLPNQRW